MWVHSEKEITKEEYDKIMSGEAKKTDFFSDAQLIGYGAIPSSPIEKDGKYYIPFGISTSCD